MNAMLWSRRRWVVGLASGLAVALAGAPRLHAQVPGFAEFSLAAVGQANGNTGVAGESRLPIRPRDATVSAGTLRLRAMGTRGSVRSLLIETQGAAGERLATASGARLVLTFASGNTLEVEPDRGWVELEARDATRVAGRFEATLTEGRVPLTLRGRFESAGVP